MRNAELIAAIHRIATGQPVTMANAIDYFHEPSLIRSVVERSGCLDDPVRRSQLLCLLKGGEGEQEITHDLPRQCA